MKINLSMLILILQAVFAYSSFSQVSKDEKYLKEKFIKIDSLCKNEMDLLCDVYGSELDKNLFMQICFWDSLKTKMASRHFKEYGKYNGPCCYWTSDGSLAMEGYYKNDKKHGCWKYYLEKKITSEENYKEGKKTGIWKEYQSGKLKKEIDYGGVQDK